MNAGSLDVSLTEQAIRLIRFRLVVMGFFLAGAGYLLVFHAPENVGDPNNPLIYSVMMVICAGILFGVGKWVTRNAERCRARLVDGVLSVRALNGNHLSTPLGRVRRIVFHRRRSGELRQIDVRGEGPPIRLFGFESLEELAKNIVDHAHQDVKILTKRLWIDAGTPSGFCLCVGIGGGAYLIVRLGGMSLTTMNWIILPIAIPLGIFLLYRMVKYRA